MDLPRMDSDQVSDVMWIRPRNPDDHRMFEALLPRCTPMFVYDDDGRDAVRWSMPKAVAADFGWNMRCQVAGCNCGEEATEQPEHAYLVDMYYHEIDWFLEREGVTP